MSNPIASENQPTSDPSGKGAREEALDAALLLHDKIIETTGHSSRNVIPILAAALKKYAASLRQQLAILESERPAFRERVRIAEAQRDEAQGKVSQLEAEVSIERSKVQVSLNALSAETGKRMAIALEAKVLKDDKEFLEQELNNFRRNAAHRAEQIAEEKLAPLTSQVSVLTKERAEANRNAQMAIEQALAYEAQESAVSEVVRTAKNALGMLEAYNRLIPDQWNQKEMEEFRTALSNYEKAQNDSQGDKDGRTQTV